LHADGSKTIVSSIIVTFINCIHISLVDRIGKLINSKEKNNKQRVTDRLFRLFGQAQTDSVHIGDIR